MKRRKRLRKGTAFLMALLMVLSLNGNSVRTVLAEEPSDVLETADTGSPESDSITDTGEGTGEIGEGQTPENVPEANPDTESETDPGNEPAIGEQPVVNEEPGVEDAESGQLSVVDWSWNDEDELLQWSEESQRWELALPGASENNPITPELLVQDYLPASVHATIEGQDAQDLVLSWDVSCFPESSWEGEYSIAASLGQGAVLAGSARPLEVTVALGGADLLALDDYLVEGLSPKGTKINLFDYWAGDDRYANDRTDSGNSTDAGINKNHNLRFGLGDNSFNGMNAWTGGSGVRADIVDNQLVNGYPILSNEYSQGTESLKYLFDPSIQHAGKVSYENVGGLLQVDNQGYYYYNCQENYAVFDETTGSFKLYEEPGVYTGDLWSDDWSEGRTNNNGQFFPFNSAESVFTERWWSNLEQVRVNSKSNLDRNGDGQNDPNATVDPPINHYFGLTMSTQFIQRDGGHTEAGGPAMTYEFSGDDDVWVFIDNVLVADLGGIHSRASLEIDFSTGAVSINGERTTTLRDQFRAARVEGNFVQSGRDNWIFADDTYHTLDFFFLERGNSDSNMRLKFNLVTVPESEIIKVDQIGEAVPGAEFELYHTGADYVIDNRAEKIATGTTNANGQFVLIDDQGRLVSLQRLNDGYEDKYFVLRETLVPTGYRPAGNGEIKLYIPENAKTPVLLAADSWNTGARAMAKVMTTSDPEIRLIANNNGSQMPGGGTVDLSDPSSGIMFGVVLQYDHRDGSPGLEDLNNWRAVSGDPINGWEVQQGTTMEYILNAAKADPNVFTLDASGAFKAEIDELPGDILTYYFMQNNPTPENTKFTVGYYYTTAEDLSGANVGNTWRVESDSQDNPFERMFAARLYVPNIENHLYVQKVDEAGNPVTGAEFGLYSDNDVVVEPDGIVSIPEGTEPAYSGTTDTLEGYPFKAPIKGSLAFPGEGGLPMGTYYLKELSVPDGYKLNDKITKVVVDNYGVYPDAGEANDGITVNRSIGMIVKSMVQFASEGSIDMTLHDLKVNLKTSDTYDYNAVDTQWQDTNQTTYLKFQPDDVHTMLEYAALEGYQATFDIDEGWSQLEIRQNYNEQGASSDLKMDWREHDLRNLFSGIAFVNVTNERMGDLEVSKTVTSELAPIDPDQAFEFTIQLEDVSDPDQPTGLTEPYRIEVTDVNGNPVQGAPTQIESGNVVNLKHGQKLTIYDLPYGTRYTVTEAETVGYVPSATVNGIMAENSGTNGYAVTGNIKWTGSGDTPGIEKVAYTNAYNGTGDFEFTKVDRDNNPLAGAKFGMYRLECNDENHNHADELLAVDAQGSLTDTEQQECWKQEKLVDSAESTGKVLFADLPVAEEYRLVECQAAPGYVTPKGQWRVIYADGSFVFPSPEANGMNSAIGNPPAVVEDADGGYTIANYKPTELPFSGNKGIGTYVFLGLLLMAVGGFGGLLWMTGNRRRRAG